MAEARNQVVLLPGLLCDETVFAHQFAALSTVADVKVADFRSDSSIEAMGLRALQLFKGPINLVGFSMGGRVALAALKVEPGRIRRLCVMDTGAAPAREGEAAERQRLLSVAEKEGMAALASQWLPPMVHPARTGDPALMAPLTQMVLRADAHQMARQVKALLNRPDARRMLGEIHCPTLIMVGRQDRWSPLAQHEAMAGEIAGARLSVIEESGHFTPVEQPDAVSAALVDWLTWPCPDLKGSAA
ncbi:MhpC Predicted hydrolases or acyltransferases (alpha/beta hydrolase superfamily) [Rhabdaerophilaceae bacterium]